MKKLLTLGLALGLVACGGSSQNALREGRAPRQQNAIFIAKMELDPAISDRFGEKRERDRRHLEFALATTRGDGTNINDRWNNRIDTEYTELPTNEFFAIEVRPGNKLAIRSIGFRTEHRYIPVFGTQHIFTTSIRNPSFKIDTVPEAGTAYYIGTIRIELDERSFREVGDGEYDRTRLRFVRANRLTTQNESATAERWFRETHPRASDFRFETVMMTPVDSGRESRFIHTMVN